MAKHSAWFIRVRAKGGREMSRQHKKRVKREGICAQPSFFLS